MCNIFNKIIEQIIHSRLTKFLNDNNFFFYKILLRKLDFADIRGIALNLFESDLSDRKQTVFANVTITHEEYKLWCSSRKCFRSSAFSNLHE